VEEQERKYQFFIYENAAEFHKMKEKQQNVNSTVSFAIKSHSII